MQGTLGFIPTSSPPGPAEAWINPESEKENKSTQNQHDQHNFISSPPFLERKHGRREHAPYSSGSPKREEEKKERDRGKLKQGRAKA